MSDKTNIFKSSKLEAQAPDSAGDRVVKSNIFKSLALNDDDGIPESPIEHPKQNVFKDKSSDARSPRTTPTYSSDTSAPPYRTQSTKITLSKFVFVGLGSLMGLAAAAYVFLSSESTPKTPSSAQLPPAENPALAPQAPIAVSNTASAAPQSTIGSLKPYLTSMLQAAHDRNRIAVDQAANALSEASRPPVGNNASARHYNDQGIASLRIKNYPAAIEAFRLGMSEDPSNVEIINNLGFALYKSGQTYPAKEQIELSLLLSPKRSSAWVNLGDVFFKEGNESSAIDAYILAYAFATNKDRIYKTVESLAENEPDSYSRIFYTRVLSSLRQTPL